MELISSKKKFLQHNSYLQHNIHKCFLDISSGLECPLAKSVSRVFYFGPLSLSLQSLPKRGISRWHISWFCSSLFPRMHDLDQPGPQTQLVITLVSPHTHFITFSCPHAAAIFSGGDSFIIWALGLWHPPATLSKGPDNMCPSSSPHSCSFHVSENGLFANQVSKNITWEVMKTENIKAHQKSNV